MWFCGWYNQHRLHSAIGMAYLLNEVSSQQGEPQRGICWRVHASCRPTLTTCT